MRIDQKQSRQMSKAPIVLAVDTPELVTAIEWVKATQDYVRFTNSAWSSS